MDGQGEVQGVRTVRNLLRTGLLTVALASAAGWAIGSMVPGVAAAHSSSRVERFRPALALVRVGVRTLLGRPLGQGEASGGPLLLPNLHLDGNAVALRAGGMIDPPRLAVASRPAASPDPSTVGHPERARVRKLHRVLGRARREAEEAHRPVRHAGRPMRTVVATMTVLATAYWPDPAWSNGYTATGWKAQYGIVAVDPSVIPLGTRMYVPGYGQAIAEDTGGAIIGDHIDLCYNDQTQALDWGAETVRIQIEHWG